MLEPVGGETQLDCRLHNSALRQNPDAKDWRSDSNTRSAQLPMTSKIFVTNVTLRMSHSF